MTEEHRLMAAGLPLEDAICICYDLRRQRDELPRFIRNQEEEYRRRMEERHERIHPV